MTKFIFEGTSKEIGLRHGIIFRREISAVLQNYLEMWKIPEEKILSAVSGFKRTIKQEYPSLAEEIQSIAVGSGVPEDFIYALNARTELLNGGSECTAVGVSSSAHRGAHVILAQNWDWYPSFRNLTRIVEIRPEKKARILTFIEPGMVGKIGLNEEGLGVCMNYLPTENIDLDGVPVHVILRTILECGDYSAAEQHILNVKKAASANYLVGHRRGELSSFETTPNMVSIMYPDPFVSHTNSFTAEGRFCVRNFLFDVIVQRYMARSADYTLSTNEINRALSVVGFPRASSLEKFLFHCLKSMVEMNPFSVEIEYLCEQRGFSYTNLTNFLTLGRIETLQRINLDLTERTIALSSGAKSDPFSVYDFSKS